jgi:hypothetical protein
MNARISGPSPMYFGFECVTCGQNAAHGKRVNTAQHYAPLWVYLSVVLGFLPLLAVYLVFRKEARLSYSLCPDCYQKRTVKKNACIAVWAAAAVSVVAAIAVGEPRVLILTGVLFLAAVVASFLMRYPLLVVGYHDFIFDVKGFGGEFLRRDGRPLPYDPVYAAAPVYYPQPQMAYGAAPAYAPVYPGPGYAPAPSPAYGQPQPAPPYGQPQPNPPGYGQPPVYQPYQPEQQPPQ